MYCDYCDKRVTSGIRISDEQLTAMRAHLRSCSRVIDSQVHAAAAETAALGELLRHFRIVTGPGPRN